MLGYGEKEDCEVVVSNVCPSPNSSLPCFPPNAHGFTEFMGSMLYGLYHLIMVIILLNMLIAMMSNTFTIIAVSCHFSFGYYIFRVMFSVTACNFTINIIIIYKTYKVTISTMCPKKQTVSSHTDKLSDNYNIIETSEF